MGNRRIGLIANSEKASCRNLVREAADLIRESRRTVLTDQATAALADLDAPTHADAAAVAGEADLLMVFGGDGTMLRVAREIAGSRTPMLGINAGGLGFLTDVQAHQLPQALKEYVMDPINASQTWRWYGYENSWVVMDGAAVQSVSGGGHWGGGMFISARDQARFGYLTLRRGKWKDKQILSEEWVRMALSPTPVQPTYGFMNWFLNTDRKYYPSAPASAFVHVGNGTNIIYVDPDNDLVVVVRWIENGKIDEFIRKLGESLSR